MTAPDVIALSVCLLHWVLFAESHQALIVRFRQRVSHKYSTSDCDSEGYLITLLCRLFINKLK